MNKIILSTLVLLFTITGFAQTKVGTVDSEYILSQMPELVEVQKSLNDYSKDLEKQLGEKVATYEKVIEAAKTAFETMSDAEKQAKQEEIAGLQQDITTFRNNGSQLVQIKQGDLLRPLYTKIGEQIDAYSKANSFTQILNTSTSATVAYIDPAYDITLAVIEKMGIVIKKD